MRHGLAMANHPTRYGQFHGFAAVATGGPYEYEYEYEYEHEYPGPEEAPPWPTAVPTPQPPSCSRPTRVVGARGRPLCSPSAASR